jgi:hypothetical protein
LHEYFVSDLNQAKTKHFKYVYIFLDTYPLQIGKWSFFSIVLDGQSKQGTLQLDYSYGYNNGSGDFKVRAKKCLFSFFYFLFKSVSLSESIFS